MTEQEAIAKLKQHLEWGFSEETSQAIQMAIDALETRVEKKLLMTAKTKRCPNCNRAVSSFWNTHENIFDRKLILPNDMKDSEIIKEFAKEISTGKE